MTGGKYDDTYLFANSCPEPIPGDPVPVPDPSPATHADPPPDEEPIKLSHRERRSARYAPADFASMTTRIDCDRFFTLNVLPPAQLTNLNELGYLT